MRTNAKYVVGLLVVQVIALCGCSPQRALAHRLKGADRVIVTNTAEGLSISITGEEVDKIVQAIATAKKESPLIDAAVGLRLDFYKGAEHLGTVIIAAQVFWVGKTPFSDTTEMLNGLYRRLREETDLKAR